MSETDNQACEVPIAEQLRSVPSDYRTCVAIQWAEDGTETGHRFIPVGYMMHRAADAIEQSKREVEAMQRLQDADTNTIKFLNAQIAELSRKLGAGK